MTKSTDYYKEACEAIPGGVNSPVRAFKGVGGTPLFIEQAKGAYVQDVDGKQYIDYVGSWGPMIVGHAHPKVLEKIQTVSNKGLSFGAPTYLEIELAEKIKSFMPHIDLIRMVNSGTEATMSAIRLARGFTNKNKIIKFAGCYHGHTDALLVQAGSGLLTCGIPSSAGVPKSFTEHTLIATYNDLDNVKKLFEEHANDLAAIIIEPVAGNMNCIPPVDGFLQGIRQLCDEHGVVFIIDEVMTGFRVAKGGAQALYNVKADLTCLGKVIGGGMPVGAFGGKKEIMDCLAPIGAVYQAGTLSGNPIAMAAGLTTLKLLEAENFYNELLEKTQYLVQGLQQQADTHNVPFTTNHVCGMFGLFFTDNKNVTNYHDVSQCSVERFNYFFHQMLDNGIYFAPSAFEAGFMSNAHSKADIDKTIEIAGKIFSQME